MSSIHGRFFNNYIDTSHQKENLKKEKNENELSEKKYEVAIDQEQRGMPIQAQTIKRPPLASFLDLYRYAKEGQPFPISLSIASIIEGLEIAKAQFNDRELFIAADTHFIWLLQENKSSFHFLITALVKSQLSIDLFPNLHKLQLVLENFQQASIEEKRDFFTKYPNLPLFIDFGLDETPSVDLKTASNSTFFAPLLLGNRLQYRSQKEGGEKKLILNARNFKKEVIDDFMSFFVAQQNPHILKHIEFADIITILSINTHFKDAAMYDIASDAILYRMENEKITKDTIFLELLQKTDGFDHFPKLRHLMGYFDPTSSMPFHHILKYKGAIEKITLGPIEFYSEKIIKKISNKFKEEMTIADFVSKTQNIDIPFSSSQQRAVLCPYLLLKNSSEYIGLTVESLFEEILDDEPDLIKNGEFMQNVPEFLLGKYNAQTSQSQSTSAKPQM